MKLYFAGPLFCQAELEFNLKLTRQLEQLGFEVFLPQRDGVERDRAPYTEMSPDERKQATFRLDRDQIYACEVFLFVLDGRVPDEGACVELGLAYAHRELTGKKRRLIGIQTDARAAFLGAKLNPMLSVPLEQVFLSEAELLNHLREYRS